MSMSKNELRNRGLNFARRQIASGKATQADIERWEKELGPEVRQPAQAVRHEATPRTRSARTVPDPSATSKES